MIYLEKFASNLRLGCLEELLTFCYYYLDKSICF